MAEGVRLQELEVLKRLQVEQDDELLGRVRAGVPLAYDYVLQDPELLALYKHYMREEEHAVVFRDTREHGRGLIVQLALLDGQLVVVKEMNNEAMFQKELVRHDMLSERSNIRRQGYNFQHQLIVFERATELDLHIQLWRMAASQGAPEEMGLSLAGYAHGAVVQLADCNRTCALCDVKLANLGLLPGHQAVTDDGEKAALGVVLIDVGSSLPHGGRPTMVDLSEVFPTAFYASPELLDGLVYPTTDMFAVARILEITYRCGPAVDQVPISTPDLIEGALSDLLRGKLLRTEWAERRGLSDMVVTLEVLLAAVLIAPSHKLPSWPWLVDQTWRLRRLVFLSHRTDLDSRVAALSIICQILMQMCSTEGNGGAVQKGGKAGLSEEVQLKIKSLFNETSKTLEAVVALQQQLAGCLSYTGEPKDSQLLAGNTRPTDVPYMSFSDQQAVDAFFALPPAKVMETREKAARRHEAANRAFEERFGCRQVTDPRALCVVSTSPADDEALTHTKLLDDLLRCIYKWDGCTMEDWERNMCGGLHMAGSGGLDTLGPGARGPKMAASAGGSSQQQQKKQPGQQQEQEQAKPAQNQGQKKPAQKQQQQQGGRQKRRVLLARGAAGGAGGMAPALVGGTMSSISPASKIAAQLQTMSTLRLPTIAGSGVRGAAGKCKKEGDELWMCGPLRGLGRMWEPLNYNRLLMVHGSSTAPDSILKQLFHRAAMGLVRAGLVSGEIGSEVYVVVPLMRSGEVVCEPQLRQDWVGEGLRKDNKQTGEAHLTFNANCYFICCKLVFGPGWCSKSAWNGTLREGLGLLGMRPPHSPDDMGYAGLGPVPDEKGDGSQPLVFTKFGGSLWSRTMRHMFASIEAASALPLYWSKQAPEDKASDAWLQHSQLVDARSIRGQLAPQ